jgi:hypothetical protein
MLILTLAIGLEYRKFLKKALDSKRLYSEKHGHTYIEAREESWDKTRPLTWSKIPLILSHLEHLEDGSLVWLSDADVLITNMSLKVEDHILPLLPHDKDLLFVKDSFNKLNSGNILMRNSQWVRDFWSRVNNRTEFTYHIMYENMAIINEFEEDNSKIHVTDQYKKFNTYLTHWEQGDFLVHFVGVNNSEKISALIDKLGTIPS